MSLRPVLVSFFVLAAVFNMMASAEDGGGILDSIIGFIRMILMNVGVIKAPITTTITGPCPQPYIYVGDGCCVDVNNNGICDRDEDFTTTTTIRRMVTTSTTSTIPTTTSTTTSTSTSTTTTLRIACYTNKDCGEAKEISICYRKGIHTKRVSYVCTNPGKPAAKCIQKEFMDITPLRTCTNSCVETDSGPECN